MTHMTEADNMTDLTVGQNVPDFSLPCDDGQTRTHANLFGQAYVLYFYPKDDTSGCTSQARDFSDLKSHFDELSVPVIGASKDSLKSHAKFRDKYSLTILLASDPETITAQAFGVWVQKSMYGRTYMGMERATFLVDSSGKIAQIWRKVKVSGHAEEVLNAVQKLL